MTYPCDNCEKYKGRTNECTNTHPRTTGEHTERYMGCKAWGDWFCESWKAIQRLFGVGEGKTV
jgi:hypothetical protein